MQETLLHVKLKILEVLFIKCAEIYVYMCLNSSEKLTLMCFHMSTFMDKIDSLTIIDSKPLLVSSNPNLNKPLILVGKKILVKPEQALGYSWNNKNKTHKLISYVVVRREEKRRKSNNTSMI